MQEGNACGTKFLMATSSLSRASGGSGPAEGGSGNALAVNVSVLSQGRAHH